MARPLARSDRGEDATRSTAPSTAAGPITGSAGAVPPPGAPHEVSQPLTPELVSDQLTRARANERELAPLVFKSADRPIVPESREVQAPAGVVAAGNVQPALQPDGAMTAVVPPALQEDLSHLPAASNSDSPSRGIPKPILDPGKQITGGFGIGSPQYFPLDGQELRVLVEELLMKVHQRIQNDLRFSIALVYPRVAARVVVEIEGFEQHDASTFQIPAVMKPHDKTAIAAARELANEVAFVVVEEAREVDQSGESVRAPDQLRQDLGLRVPRKQQVQTGLGGLQLADVVVGIGDQ